MHYEEQFMKLSFKQPFRKFTLIRIHNHMPELEKDFELTFNLAELHLDSLQQKIEYFIMDES